MPGRNKINTVFYLKQVSQKINISESLDWREQIANSMRVKQEVNLLALIRRLLMMGPGFRFAWSSCPVLPIREPVLFISLLSFTMPASSLLLVVWQAMLFWASCFLVYLGWLGTSVLLRSGRTFPEISSRPLFASHWLEIEHILFQTKSLAHKWD